MNKFKKIYSSADYVKMTTILFVLEFVQIHFRNNTNASAGFRVVTSCFLKKKKNLIELKEEIRCDPRVYIGFNLHNKDISFLI